MAQIEIIDDDRALELLQEALYVRGHEVRLRKTAADALEHLQEIANSDIIVLDIMMEWPAAFSAGTPRAVRSTGIVLYRKIRELNPNVKIIIYSVFRDDALLSTISRDRNGKFVSKLDGRKLSEIANIIEEFIGLLPNRPMVFIVHGHDDAGKLELKNYLQNTLGMHEPIILHEQPNLGRLILEKLEDYAMQSGLVFVLLTPDDVCLNNGTNDERRRARQNVIFELGYFLGIYGRRSGRIILLHRGPLDIPSDISGLIYIDISHGVEAAGEQIRREIQHATG